MKNTGSGGAWLRCAVVGAAAFKAAAPRVSGRVYNAFTGRRSRCLPLPRLQHGHKVCVCAARGLKYLCCVFDSIPLKNRG